MMTDREYGIEARIILKKLQDAGVTFVKTTASDTADVWGPADSEDDYYGISCDGLSIGEIVYNLWNLEDSILVAKNPDGEDTHARFIFGNGWGELMGDYSTNLLGTRKNDILPESKDGRMTFSRQYRDEAEAIGLYDYENWRINDVLRFFEVTNFIEDMIDDAMPSGAERMKTINRGSPLISNEARLRNRHTGGIRMSKATAIRMNGARKVELKLLAASQGHHAVRQAIADGFNEAHKDVENVMLVNGDQPHTQKVGLKGLMMSSYSVGNARQPNVTHKCAWTPEYIKMRTDRHKEAGNKGTPFIGTAGSHGLQNLRITDDEGTGQEWGDGFVPAIKYKYAWQPHVEAGLLRFLRLKITNSLGMAQAEKIAWKQQQQLSAKHCCG